MTLEGPIDEFLAGDRFGVAPDKRNRSIATRQIAQVPRPFGPRGPCVEMTPYDLSGAGSAFGNRTLWYRGSSGERADGFRR
jgi:hypothetical protein